MKKRRNIKLKKKINKEIFVFDMFAWQIGWLNKKINLIPN